MEKSNSNIGKTLYRCRHTLHVYDVKIVFDKYTIHKETKSGYWIGCFRFPFNSSNAKFMFKKAKKRFARFTKKEALEDYIKRTDRSIIFTKSKLAKAEKGLSIAIDMIGFDMIEED